MIVFPGQPGRSHDHTYFGNTSTNASSTLASLQASGSTCLARGDRAAYWVPTLAVKGKVVQPLGATIYYVRRTTNPVQPFPPGFRMIAGDATARTAQSIDVTSWKCGLFGGGTSSVPSCRFPTVQLRVRFPDCWDGTHLDVADHKAHMAYSSGGTCPASHPVALPGLLLDVVYPVTGGPTTVLSSGGQFSGHADFVERVGSADPHPARGPRLEPLPVTRSVPHLTSEPFLGGARPAGLMASAHWICAQFKGAWFDPLPPAEGPARHDSRLTPRVTVGGPSAAALSEDG